MTPHSAGLSYESCGCARRRSTYPGDLLQVFYMGLQSLDDQPGTFGSVPPVLFGEHRSDDRYDLVDFVDVQPVEGGHQLELSFEIEHERPAIDIPPFDVIITDVVQKRPSAVEYRGRTNPFERVRVAEDSEVVQMSVGLQRQVVDGDHPVQEGYDVQSVFLAQADDVRVEVLVVPSLHALHGAVDADELRVRGDEIPAGAQEYVVVFDQIVFDVVDPEDVHHLRGDHFVVRLLVIRFVAVLHQTSVIPVDDPPLP